MCNILLVNDVIKFIDDGIFKRILWIDEENINCYAIELFTSKTIISLLKIKDIYLGIVNGTIEIEKNDPLLKLVFDDELSDSSKQKRDKAYEVITYITAEIKEPEIYSQSKRKIVCEAEDMFAISKGTIYSYLRKYWQSGKFKNGLIPNYDKCGAKGQKRVSDKKLGRPNSETYLSGENLGVAINEQIRNIFDNALERHFYNSKEKNLSLTYRLMLKDFFTEGTTIDGVKQLVLMDEDRVPTKRQFQYYYYSQRDVVQETMLRKGRKRFNLDYREIKSNSTVETIGPGFRYQVDATIADVYLVSRFDRKSIIGRPVVYLAVDVFSRMIAGVYVGLEGPSWNGVSSLLYNCMENKVDYCKKYGINISNEDWPAEGIPRVVLADRGELIGPIGENVITGLGISIENTPSYRGDAKGIVEQNFRVLNSKIKKWLPGEVKKDYRERGEKHYALGARLDIYQFTQIILHAILNRNLNYIKNYPLTEEMIKYEVNPIPIELWNWGIKYKSGSLRRLPKELLKQSLMRKGTATVTERGIVFNNMVYTCKSATDFNWLSKARIDGSWNINIIYDNRDMSEIYMIDSEKHNLESCYLKQENTMFKSKTFEEVVDLGFNKSAKLNKLQNSLDQKNIDMDISIEKIVKEAERLYKETEDSAAIRLKGIRNNRKIENDMIRKSQALKINDNKIISEDEDGDVKTDDILTTQNFNVDSKLRLVEELKKLKERKRQNG